MTSAEAFRDAFGRHLRRRRLAAALEGARGGGWRALLAAAGVLLLAVLGVLPRPERPEVALLLYAAFLVAGTVLGVLVALRRAGGSRATARALDGVLGREDLVATASALAGRSGSGRFAGAVLERAGAEVAALSPDRVGPLPRPPWALLLLVAAVAALLPLMPPFGLGLLPGLGAGAGAGGPPRDDGVALGPRKEKDGGAPEQAAKGKEAAEEQPAEKEAKPPDEVKKPSEATPPAPSPGAVARLSLSALARTYPPAGPVTIGAVADGGPGAGSGTDLDLAVAVDGGPAVAEKRPFRLAAGGHEARALDLRTLPGLPALLGPGKHRVKGTLRDAAGNAVAEAPEIEVVVEGGSDDRSKGKGKGAEPPPPRPAPAPAPEQPPEPRAPKPKGDRPAPKPEAPDIPESRFDRRFVQPLFGEGAEIEKRGPLLVLDPEGSRGEAPREVLPEEALREVKAAAETAARREGVDPRDLETIRLYFEALRRIVEGKK